MLRSNRLDVIDSRGLAVRAPGRQETQSLGDWVEYSLITDDDRRRQATRWCITGGTATADLIKLDNARLYDGGRPVVSGPLDLRMGPTDQRELCVTCGNMMGKCPGHYGCIELARPVLPFDGSTGPLTRELMRVLYSVCIQRSEDGFPCCTPMSARGCPAHKLDGQSSVRVTVGSKSRVVDMRRESQHGKQKAPPDSVTVECLASNGTILSQARYETVQVRDVLDLIDSVVRDDPSVLMDRLRALSLAARRELSDALQAEMSRAQIRYLGHRPNLAQVVGSSRVAALCPRVILVVPPVHRPDRQRPMSFFQSSHQHPGGCTEAYQRVIRVNNELLQVINTGASSKAAYRALLAAIFDLMHGKATRRGTDEVAEKTDFAGLMDVLSGRNRGGGKHGLARSMALGKRVSDNVRAVILGNSSIPLDRVGVPANVMARMTREVPIVASDASRLEAIIKDAKSLRLAGVVSEEEHLKFGPARHWDLRKRLGKADMADLIERIRDSLRSRPGRFLVRRPMRDGEVVMLNRQPTLQRQNVMSTRVMALPASGGNTSCIVVNPQLAKPYNLDFDGDQMGMFVPHDAIEALELGVLHAPAMLAASANGQVVMEPGQSTVMGWYALSELYTVDTPLAELPPHLAELLQETLRDEDLQTLGRRPALPTTVSKGAKDVVMAALSRCLPSDLTVTLDVDDVPADGWYMDCSQNGTVLRTPMETWRHLQVTHQATYAAIAVDANQRVLGGFVQSPAAPEVRAPTPATPATGHYVVRPPTRREGIYGLMAPPAVLRGAHAVVCAGVATLSAAKTQLVVIKGQVLQMPRMTMRAMVRLVQASYDSGGGSRALATLMSLQRTSQAAIVHLGARLALTAAPADLQSAIVRAEALRSEMRVSVAGAPLEGLGQLLSLGLDQLRDLPSTYVSADRQLRHGQRGEELGILIRPAIESAVLGLVGGGMATSAVSGAKGKVLEHLAWVGMGIGPLSAEPLRPLPCERGSHDDAAARLTDAGFAGSDTFTMGFLDFGRFMQSQELGCRGDMQGKDAVGEVGYIDRKQLLEHMGTVAGPRGEVWMLAGAGRSRIISPLYGGDGMDPQRRVAASPQQTKASTQSIDETESSLLRDLDLHGLPGALALQWRAGLAGLRGTESQKRQRAAELARQVIVDAESTRVEYGAPVGSWAVEALFADLSQEALDSKHGHGRRSIKERLTQLLEPPLIRPVILSMRGLDQATCQSIGRGRTVADLVLDYQILTCTHTCQWMESGDIRALPLVWNVTRDGTDMTWGDDSDTQVTFGDLSETPHTPNGMVMRVHLRCETREETCAIERLILSLGEHAKSHRTEWFKKHRRCMWVGEEAVSRTEYAVWLACTSHVALDDPNTVGEALGMMGLWSEGRVLQHIDRLSLEPDLDLVLEGYRRVVAAGQSTTMDKMHKVLVDTWGQRAVRERLSLRELVGVEKVCCGDDDGVVRVHYTTGSTHECPVLQLMRAVDPALHASVDLDDPRVAERRFGVEIGRLVLARGLAEMRPNALPRHVGLVADTMTMDGSIRGVNHSASKTVRTPLELMAFERVEGPIIKAAIERQGYSEDGVFTAALFNRPAQVGTGLVGVGERRPNEPVNRNLMGEVALADTRASEPRYRAPAPRYRGHPPRDSSFDASFARAYATALCKVW